MIQIGRNFLLGEKSCSETENRKTCGDKRDIYTGGISAQYVGVISL